MNPGRANSRIIQVFGTLLAAAGLLLLLDLLRPATTTPGAAWAAVVALIGGGVGLIGRGSAGERSELRYPQGSRRLLLAGLAVGGAGAMIASGGLFPTATSPGAVQLLAALLLLGGLGLVHRGRPARQYERRVLGYVLFTASLGAASLVVFPHVPAWAVAVCPLAALGLWVSLRLELGEPAPRSPAGSRPLLIAGLTVGGVGALIASGGVLPPASNPAPVYVLAGALLLAGLGLVERGRSAGHDERQILGFVLFTASIGAASLLLFQQAGGWSLLAIPIALLGLWMSLRFELGQPPPRYPAGSRPLLLAGLAVGGLAALIASGGVVAPSENPGAVNVLAAALLFAGLGLVHLGRSARHYERLILGFVLFTASVGAASFVLLLQAQGWSLLAIPIAVLGLWTALRLEIGGTRTA